MKSLLHFTFLVCAVAVTSLANDKISYPKPPSNGQTDDYFGTQVADPFRPLEELDSPATKNWIEAENKITFDYIEKIPERKRINDRLTDVWNYEKFGIPFQEGGKYFFSKNTGLQNQSVVYVTSALPGEARVLIDPNTL